MEVLTQQQPSKERWPVAHAHIKISRRKIAERMAQKAVTPKRFLELTKFSQDDYARILRTGEATLDELSEMAWALDVDLADIARHDDNA